MSHIITGPAEYTFARKGAAYLPVRSGGFANTYYSTGDFCIDMNTFNGGTSGAPGAAVWDTMALCLTDKGGVVSSKDGLVTVEIPEGQKLLVMDDTRSDTDKWAEFASLVELPSVQRAKRQAFWFLPEYVTWVEQGIAAKAQGKHQREPLDEAFVLDYMARIESLGLPKGKLTLDDGWQECLSLEDWTDGYWKPDTAKFPDFEGLITTIQQHGFVPSLWMGIPSVPASAPILATHPALFDDINASELATQSERYYYKPSDASTAHFRAVLAPYVAMGVGKFKFDFFYGERQRMRGIMKCLHEAVRALSDTVEIESHHPDPFFACYTDVFRLNDVHVVPGFDWKGLTLEHINQGNNMAVDCILNLDHLGGNTGSVTEADYLRHMKLFEFVREDRPQYPVLSVLPDRYSAATVEKVVKYIEKHTVIEL